MDLSTLTPYRKGLITSTKKLNEPFKECLYDIGTKEYEEWWKGYCDGTELLMLEINLYFLNQKSTNDIITIK